MIGSHHCDTSARVIGFSDDLTPVWIVHRFRSTAGKITVRSEHIQHVEYFFKHLEVVEKNSLVAASYSKRLHADTLVTVTGDPALSYTINLSHVFTAP